MIFRTITTPQLMSRMRGFIHWKPESKVSYARNRSRVKGEDVSGLADDQILEHLSNNENIMQDFINQYDDAAHLITAKGLVLDRKFLTVTRNFIHCALPRALHLILVALDKPSSKAAGPEIQVAIDSLFNDRLYLRKQLLKLLRDISNPRLVSEIVYTDRNTFDRVFAPIVSPPVIGEQELYGAAFSEFMGVESCLLVNYRCLEVNELYKAKVKGFDNEFFLHVMTHELAHLLLGANDNSYSSADGVIENYNVYSAVNLKAHELDNADNYVALIFIALAHMHKKGRINLARY
ncbi:hypothetical protein [Pseudomonas sp. UV AK001]|uniref:hypothetical protein n=1 Tax=Pseudomonas sp. UV AK001 TaxID=3384791 RepID=UPI0038D3D409